ncbi:hypothetical protein LV89_01603 [Arcicella aurantiaca]|uniref:Methyltransferase type 11 domain-containing protein n=1 Tax=Arcicella aurantiaca TaxID=591202 RepID=A0A316ED36_9BACT|nr:class I SAM-dependent methyltransferase [Arcicella aurantiaca]PWK27290.1 hypothetical protein LV89_01603 [Arcicella aurantiaca]
MSERNTLIDDKSYTNLEIGAGCGDFGKKFYPKCYLTDYDANLRESCELCHIDWFCDAHELPWGDNRFDTIILCNPYNYGFNDDDSTDKLMKELLRVLKVTNSKIILISTKNNKHCNPQRVSTRISAFCKKNNISNMNVSSEEIDCNSLYENYVFKEVLGDQIFPSCKITIDVQ